MKNKTAKILLSIGVAVIAIVIGLLALSPYKRNGNTGSRSLQTTIAIDVPADSVFQYLGNSANASAWSSFVDHIIPLNPEIIPDGKKGSFRRCFARADRKGMAWDEEIIYVEPNKKRILTIFNLQNFAIGAEGLVTEQRYEPMGNNRVQLTFALSFGDEPPGFIRYVKMKLAAYRIAAIFEKNLANIKRICEEK